MTTRETARRPIRARGARWARGVAGWLQRAGLRPNQVSLASIAFAGLAGASLVLAGRMGDWRGEALYVAAAAFIQLRLLCNLFDGMLAVEGGLKTRSGEVFNDLPDRVADSLILVAAGYSIVWAPWGSEMGWAAALLAMGTAYVRVLGGAAGGTQHYLGPMAKQHRMAVMTVACVTSAALAFKGSDGLVMAVALAIVVVGCVITVARRTWAIIKELESR